MKKGYVIILVLIVVLTFVVGCQNEIPKEQQDINGQDYFNAKVIEVYDGILEVECLDVTSGAINEGAKVHVSKTVASTNAVPDVKVGDEIRVVFSGGVMETYPLQLQTVWAIYALGEDGNVIAGEQSSNTEAIAGNVTEPGLVEMTTEHKNMSDERGWGISLMATDVSPYGMTLVCTQSDGSPTGELQTGSEYRLYTKKSGVWVEVPTVRKDFCWDAVAYSIPMNESREFEINWEWLYGELPVGTYRIGKEIMDFRGAGDYDEEWYYAEFEVK